MKAYIYFLSLLLTFAPVYANAILPSAVAVAGSTSGRVVLTKASGAVLRTLSPSSLGALAKNAVGICAKNPLAFAFCTTVISAIKGDGWDITINNNQTNNDVDVEIYKKYSSANLCRLEIAYKYNNSYYHSSSSAAQAFVDKVEADKKAQNPNINIEVTYDDISQLTSKMSSEESRLNQIMADGVTIPSTWSNAGNANFTYITKVDTFTNKSTASLPLYYRCTPYQSNGKYYIDDNYLYKIVSPSFSDDDITNIYNYDFSQHTNIKINDKSDTGDNINNTVKNSDSENDKKMTKTAAQKSKNKSPDYHPDKINDNNCSKDDAGAYDKCGSDRDEDDDTASSPASTPTPTDPPEDDDDDDDEPPIECNSNGFYKKVCDWMDWTQEEPTEPNDEKPPIKDIESESSNKIDMGGSCPAPYQINFSVFGHSQDNSISYQPLCDALEMLKPIFVGAGALSSMFILMGYSRPNSTGVND